MRESDVERCKKDQNPKTIYTVETTSVGSKRDSKLETENEGTNERECPYHHYLWIWKVCVG